MYYFNPFMVKYTIKGGCGMYNNNELVTSFIGEYMNGVKEFYIYKNKFSIFDFTDKAKGEDYYEFDHFSKLSLEHEIKEEKKLFFTNQKYILKFSINYDGNIVQIPPITVTGKVFNRVNDEYRRTIKYIDEYLTFKEDEINELETYISQFISNVTFPSILLLPFYRAELLQKWIGDNNGINFEGTDSSNELYYQHIKPFIHYLQSRNISVEGKEKQFIDILHSQIEKTNFDYLYDEYYDILDKGDTIESCVFKYLEVSNFDETLYDRITSMDFLRKFIQLKFEQSLTFENLSSSIKDILETYKFESKMKNFEKTIENEKSFKPTIDHTDIMSGQEFEEFLLYLFSNLGYNVETTKTTGDQGVDLLLYKNNQSIAVQAKCYSSSIGNSAIQQVVAGQQYYKADKTMVVTNNYFTSSAKELASTTGTMLWDRDKLKEMIELVF